MLEASPAGTAKTHFNRALKMQALPGSEYYLYTVIRQRLRLDSLREVFILGIRCIYSMWHDPALRPVLLNLLTQLQQERDAMRRGEALPHKYEMAG